MLLSANLLWHPQANNTVWDCATPNWLDIDTNTPTVFHDGDNVTFDDSGGGGTVSIISTGVSPGSVTDNSSRDYLLQSADNNADPGIDGPGSLIKQGSGKLTLQNVINDYAGATDIQSGILALNWATLGDGTGTVTVEHGAGLDILGPGWGPALSNLLVLNGSGVDGSGALFSGGPSNYGGYWKGPITIATASVINTATDPMELGGNIEDDGGLRLGGGNLILVDGAVTGAGGVTKTGSGSAVFGGPGKTYSGPTEVVSGTLQDGGGASGELSPYSRYTVDAGATLQDFGYDTLGSLAGAGTINILAATLDVGADNTSSTFSGTITGQGSLDKVGAGTLVLAGTEPNTALGFLDLDGGVVELDKPLGVNAWGASGHRQTGPYGSDIAVSSGTLRWDASNQVPDTTSIACGIGGTIDFNSHDETLFYLNGGNVTTGAGAVTITEQYSGPNTNTWGLEIGSGTLTIGAGGSITCDSAEMAGYGPATADIYGTLNTGNGVSETFGGNLLTVHAGGTINTSTGQWVVTSPYPPQNTVTVDAGGVVNIGSGGLDIHGFDGDSFGSVAFTLNSDPVNPGRLKLGGALSGAGAIASGGSAALPGVIDLGASDRTISLDGHIGARITGSGGIIVNAPVAQDGGLSLLNLDGSNDYTGSTTVVAGMLRLGSAGALGSTPALTVLTGGVLDLYGQSIFAIPLTLNGPGFLSGLSAEQGVLVNLGGQSSTVAGPVVLAGDSTIGYGGDQGITITSAISGPGQLTDRDQNGGTRSLVLSSSANSYSGGTVVTDAPAYAAGSPGCLTVSASGALGTGPLSLPDAILTLDNVTDQITASSVSLAPKYPGRQPSLVINGLAPLDSYEVIKNSGSAPVTGTFNGLPQGASLVVGGKNFYINYKGGDGNDVVITTSPVPTTVATSTLVAGATATYGGPTVLLSATVAAGSGSAVNEGSITFTVLDSDNNPVGSPITVAVADGAASASFPTTGLGVGHYSVTAIYHDPSVNPLFGDSQGSGSLTITDQNLQGMVWVDFNNDGNVDFGEQGIDGVSVTLTGTDDLNQAVLLSTQTSNGGIYTFNHIRPGTYTITENGAPTGYIEGKDSAGTLGGDASVQDVFSTVLVSADQNGVNYNFGEQPAPGSSVAKGQGATMGFWQNKNGQALIRKFTSIGAWLAATMPQTFGYLADFNGSSQPATPQQVASLYQQRFVLTDKLDAQVMATALNVYATDQFLGGPAAAYYGFAVGTYGLGDSTWNIGSDGAAFGVTNNSTLTIMQILQDWDQQTNKNATTLRKLAIDAFGSINSKGGL